MEIKHPVFLIAGIGLRYRLTADVKGVQFTSAKELL